MNSIEKEIIFCGKTFDLVRAGLDKGELSVEYQCRDFPILVLFFNETETENIYYFYIGGNFGSSRKTDVEAFDNISNKIKLKIGNLIDNANYEIEACKKKLKERKKDLDEYNKYLIVFEEMYKECKVEMDIKDIIE